jgi:hypothetical protein
MGIQKDPRLPSRLAGHAKTTTTTNKTPTVTLFDFNGTFSDSSFNLDEIIAENKRRAEEEAAVKQLRLEQERIAEEQRKLEEEQAIVNEIAKKQEERKNSITFFKTPSNEDFAKLMNCYKNLPHKLKNIEVKNMRSSIEIDLDDEDWEELELDADFEGVTIEPKSGGSTETIISLPMQEDFVKAINANTETLKEKYNTLRSRYIETIEEGNTIIEKVIKPFDEEYQIEYDNIVKEEHEFLFGENSIIDMFNESKEDVIEELVKKNPKDKEIKNDFKKLKKNLKLEVEFSDPIKVVTSIDYDANGIITKVHRKSINTKMTLTLKYPKKSGGTPKEIYSETFNLLDS